MLNKATPYVPADAVSYTINIIDRTTKKAITTDSYVQFSVVDANSNAGVASLTNLQTSNAFIGQIKNYDSEVLYSQSLLTSVAQSDVSTNYLDLVLGVQQWRIGAFNVDSLLNIGTILNKGS